LTTTRSSRRISLADRIRRAIATRLRPIWTPPPFVYLRLHFAGEFEVQCGPRTLRMYSDSTYLENAVFWEGIPYREERCSLGLWMKLAETSEVILDIGANTGIFALVAKCMNPTARVYGFEPVHRVWERFKRSVDLNGFDIRCIEAAASNADGEATIYDAPTDHIYSVTVGRDLNPPGSVSIPTTVRTMRVDTLVRDEHLPRVDLVKIDVETHEPQVLEGMSEALSAFRPTMLVEVLNDEVASRVDALLAGLGYLFFDIDEATGPRRVPVVRRASFRNVLACQPEVAHRLGLA
jgi:FkbM family methyltransferase